MATVKNPYSVVKVTGQQEDRPGLSSERVARKVRPSCSLSAESTSSLTSTGSCRPALANCTRSLGRVAENRRVCLGQADGQFTFAAQGTQACYSSIPSLRQSV